MASNKNEMEKVLLMTITISYKNATSLMMAQLYKSSLLSLAKKPQWLFLVKFPQGVLIFIEAAHASCAH